jgi:hypothetical protein
VRRVHGEIEAAASSIAAAARFSRGADPHEAAAALGLAFPVHAGVGGCASQQPCWQQRGFLPVNPPRIGPAPLAIAAKPRLVM